MQINNDQPRQKRPPRPHSIDDFAQRYGISRRTVYNEITRGRLETIKMGKRRIITQAQEDAYLKRCEA